MGGHPLFWDQHKWCARKHAGIQRRTYHLVDANGAWKRQGSKCFSLDFLLSAQSGRVEGSNPVRRFNSKGINIADCPISPQECLAA